MGLKNIFDKWWADDLDYNKRFPTERPLLAHYTSIAVFEQIMRNDEVWFSHPLNMNDFEELRFGMIEGANLFRNNEALRKTIGDLDKYEELVKCFNDLYMTFDTNHGFHTYLMCFSEHEENNNDGLLSMWRGYGADGAGVAIVFDTKKMEPNDDSPLIVGSVKYDTVENRRALISRKIESIADVLKDRDLDSDELNLAAYYLIERLKRIALFTKHSGFQEENEWRIVYMSERDPDELFEHMHSYAITQRGAELKLKVKVKPLDGVFGNEMCLENLVHKIILGPTISTALSERAVTRILETTGKNELIKKIVHSTIPFRP